MLTRGGVAKRLGKSIATVRRMEGVELHPVRDERGVHRFDPDEVEQIANALSRPPSRHRTAELYRWRNDCSDGSEGRGAYETITGASIFEELQALAAQIRCDAEMVLRDRQMIERMRAHDERLRREAAKEEVAVEQELIELLEGLGEEWLDDLG